MSTPARLLKIIAIIVILGGIPPTSYARKIPVMTFSQFEKILHVDNDTTYVINFWATWCVPCRKELPYFEKISKELEDQKVKIILVSLDFPDKIEGTVIPFLEKNAITAFVILLDDPDSNAWIDKVDPKWSGSIPATLIYKRTKREFHETEFNYESLNKAINGFLNI